MKRKLSQKTLSTLLALSLSMSFFTAGCGLASKATNDKTAAKPATTQEEKMKEADSKLSANRNTPIVQAAKKVGPTVVGITNKALVRDYFNRTQLVEKGSGSGVIYSKDGLIVTNNHVVAGAQEIVVSLSNGKTYTGKVLGTDPTTDLAVVKIQADEDLPVAEFGDSDTLMVGEPAIAIGNPLGMEFRGTVTAGVISALNRTIDLGEQRFRLIQTDAAINPGNSGGALANADGQVIGINSAKIVVSGVEGIGFAIPINEAKPIIKQLAEQGRVVRPYLGVSLIDKTLAERFGFNIDLRGGLFVAKLFQNGPAYQGGIRPNDIITKFNGTKVDSVAALRDALNKCQVGQTVPVTILRGDTEVDKNVTLTEMPQQDSNN
ncbi:trypsin-like peptidase domain-containing protein [Acidaminococcus sp. NSJ-142]|jgi:serine protease Do|uniref:S1C family serine protease n=1 Tax=Acidaminococcus TaxID=904 RepID=UPI000CF841CB|nr:MULTISPECIES: trypsin-like peptidase domain-containing protein [Acidaminococcus]MCD2435057.1 trypsin-like peptidase domain-containing protein [Acidaminococcus hominis]MCH4096425.1 trypsin-like peptidase domain-containing protein [Acidaminococcus provencensis]RHK02897.1 PDZ domain-containing protein [Acidaminococcus sp. AM05-11]